MHRLKSRKATMTAVEDLNVTKCNKFSFGSKDQRYKMEKPDPNQGSISAIYNLKYKAKEARLILQSGIYFLLSLFRKVQAF